MAGRKSYTGRRQQEEAAKDLKRLAKAAAKKVRGNAHGVLHTLLGFGFRKVHPCEICHVAGLWF